MCDHRTAVGGDQENGEEYGEEQVCFVSFALTKLLALTATAVSTSTPEPSKTPPPTPTSSPEGGDVLVILEGSLSALQVDGKFVLHAVELECTLPNGSKTRIAFSGYGWYPVPAGARVGLWIGAALGGSDWWKVYNSQPVAVVDGVVVLTISKIESEPQFNGRPYPSPTPRRAVPTPTGREPIAPTHTPPRPTVAPTPTAYPPAKTPTRGPMLYKGFKA